MRKPATVRQPQPVLKTSRRFDEHSGIGQLARAVNAGDSQMLEDSFQNRQFTDITRILLSDAQDSQLDHLVVAGGMDFFTGANAVAVSGYSHYLSIMQQTRPAPDSASQAYQDWAQQVLAAFDQFRLLCALRQGDWGVTGLNQRIYENLLAAELIKDRHDWYEGRPVMITQNDYSLGLMNGDIGIALQFPTPLSNAENTGLRVVFPQPDGIKTILPSRLSAYETAYAMTVHKSQGSEFNHVALVLPDKFSPVLTRELVYT
ncbi:MAG: ATP-binding domain-containing protein, partial [Methylococcales bacterium]